jgi:hypothetical protein
VSTNLPLWGSEEEKRLLVIALPLWDPQRRRTSFVGVNFGLNLVSPFACLNSLFQTNPRTCFSPIYQLVAIQLISVIAGGS